MSKDKRQSTFRGIIRAAQSQVSLDRKDRRTNFNMYKHTYTATRIAYPVAAGRSCPHYQLDGATHVPPCWGSSSFFAADAGLCSAPLGAKGMADVAVNTGRSLRRMAAGVAVLGGSHLRDSCWGTETGDGPSGW